MSKAPKVIAVVLARLTSSRLPEKQMRLLAGLPLIFHVIERLQTVASIDQIVVATASEERNKKLGEYVKSLNVSVRYDEDEDDVTGRVLRTAEEYGADIIVTISGDCPLIDPEFIKDEINALTSSGCDYAGPHKITGKCLHEGISTHTIQAYRRLYSLSDTWFYREHPASALHDHPDSFSKIEVDFPDDFAKNLFRISVDNIADLIFMNIVYKHLYREGNIVDLHDVVSLLEREPLLREINQHVHQKTVRETTYTILFLSHASSDYGFGHLSRILTLAKELLESSAVTPVLALPEDTQAMSFAYSRGFTSFGVPDFSNTESLQDIIETKKPDAIVIDMKQPLPDALAALLDKVNMPVAAIDMQPDNFEPDLTFIPAIERDDAPPLKRDNTYRGNKWILLDRMVQFYRSTRTPSKEILISGGGSVHTLENFLSHFRNLSDTHPLLFTIGSYVNRVKFEEKLNNNQISNYRIAQNPDNPLELYAGCKAAILLFGVTAYETIALGVPTVIVGARTEQDHSIVKELAKRGAAYSLISDLRENREPGIKLLTLLQDTEQLADLSDKGCHYIDGKGTERIAMKILQHIGRSP